MHTAFWVLSTYYEMDLDRVSHDSPDEEFTEEDLVLVREETCGFTETLASKYEEEALSKKDGEN